VILAEGAVEEVLRGIGLTLVAKNHVMRRPDGTAEGEVDLVFTYANHTFVIEVSANAQSDARRIKRKRLREWVAGGRLADLSSELGLPAANAIRTVYVDLSGHVGMAPGALDGGTVLGEFHMAMLVEEPEGGLENFLCWTVLPAGDQAKTCQ